jgi:hypothetical protein
MTTLLWCRRMHIIGGAAAVTLTSGGVGAQAAAPASAASPAPPPTPVVHYENGRILETSVPYHRSFRIVGPRSTPRGRADVVRGVVQRRKDRPAFLAYPWTWSNAISRRRTPSALETTCWVAPAHDSGEDFSLTLGPLPLGQPFHIELEFYGSAPAMSLAAASRSAMHDLVAVYGQKKSVTDEDIRRTLDSRMNELVERLTAAGAKEVLFLDLSVAGRCPLSDQRPPNPLVGLEKQINSAAQGMILQQDAIRRFDEGRQRVMKVAEKVPPLVERLRVEREREQQAIRDETNRKVEEDKKPVGRRKPVQVSSPTLLYTNDDLIAVLRMANGADTAGVPRVMEVDAFSRLSPALDSKGVTPEDKATLRELLDGALRMNTTTVEYLQGAKAQHALDGLSAQLHESFFALAHAELGAVPWDTDSEVRKVQIGTAYGGAFTFLDVGKNAADDGFGFLLMKFYFGPVDKTLPRPYSSWRSHFSFDVGAVSRSTVKYRGQEQDDAIAGLKPMVGLGIDIQRRIALHGGMLLFRQPSINPLATERKRLRASPFIGLGFDFDLFNQLSTMIGDNQS